jgi:hypothetical protein
MKVWKGEISSRDTHATCHGERKHSPIRMNPHPHLGSGYLLQMAFIPLPCKGGALIPRHVEGIGKRKRKRSTSHPFPLLKNSRKAVYRRGPSRVVLHPTRLLGLLYLRGYKL